MPKKTKTKVYNVPIHASVSLTVQVEAPSQDRARNAAKDVVKKHFAAQDMNYTTMRAGRIQQECVVERDASTESSNSEVADE